LNELEKNLLGEDANILKLSNLNFKEMARHRLLDEDSNCEKDNDI